MISESHRRATADPLPNGSDPSAPPVAAEPVGAERSLGVDGEAHGPRARRAVLRIAIALYLVGLGMCTGVVLDRIRFDRQRSEVIGRYEQALREWHTIQMSLEKQVEGRRQ